MTLLQFPGGTGGACCFLPLSRLQNTQGSDKSKPQLSSEGSGSFLPCRSHPDWRGTAGTDLSVSHNPLLSHFPFCLVGAACSIPLGRAHSPWLLLLCSSLDRAPGEPTPFYPVFHSQMAQQGEALMGQHWNWEAPAPTKPRRALFLVL